MGYTISGAVLNEADKIIPITMEQARALPNMLGAIAPHELRARGYYAVTRDGVKTLYLLEAK